MKSEINNNSLPEYDFLGSIYEKTKPNEFAEALDSIKIQTLKPKNIILVIDGYILDEVVQILNKYKKTMPITLVVNKNNMGHGLALKKGLKKCESEIILRFDHDDINLENRAFYTVKELAKGNIDIVGSSVYEFENNPKKIVSLKIMPTSHKLISRSIYIRNPINHPTVGFIKKSIIKLNGGYRDFKFYEDYDLWIRALSAGLRFKNLESPLVAMRINGQRDRRRGLHLIGGEYKLLMTFFEQSISKGILFLPSLTIRMFFVLLPLNVVSFFYKYLLRKKFT